VIRLFMKGEDQMDPRVARDVRILKIYSAGLTLICAVLLLSAFQSGQKTKFQEIDVERINIVEPDGKIDLAISNAVRFPPPVLNGKVMKRSGEVGKGTPGMIFFNGDGEEQGGLAWNSRREDGKYSAGAALMFDQYKQDQTIGLQYSDDNGKRTAGLMVWDHPETPITDIWEKSQEIAKMKPGPEKDQAQKRLAEAWGAQRVFAGKRGDKSAALLLSDTEGKVRIQVVVDASGNPKIDFLDANGEAIYSLPPAR
jgi:hypothetical protein